MELKIMYEYASIFNAMRYFIYRDEICVGNKATLEEANEVFERQKVSPEAKLVRIEVVGVSSATPRENPELLEAISNDGDR